MSSPADKSPGLGSLAQSARGKQLKQARIILLVVGGLTILVNALLLANVRNEAKQAVGEEVKKVENQGMRADPAEVQKLEDHVVRVAAVIYGAVIFLGILFVVFGLTIKLYPVPITIISLILYVGAAAVFAVLNPATLLQGVIIKVIIIVGLAKAIQSAIAFERERQQAAIPTVEPGYE
jgi:predicted RND superfamily exporter protein